MSNQFRIGQRLISLATWEVNGPKKDEVVTCNGPGKGCCMANMFLKEYRSITGVTRCAMCGKKQPGRVFSTKYFRPLQEDLTAELATSWRESVPSEQEQINVPLPQQA